LLCLQLAALVAEVIAVAAFRPVKAEALVFPSVAIVWFGLAVYLLILGLMAEGCGPPLRASSGAGDSSGPGSGMKPSGVSVIIPLHERCDPLGPLYKEYLDPLRAAGLIPEFLFVAAPSHAAQANEADVLRKSGEPVRVLRLAQPTGPAMLTRVGANEAKNDLLLVLPAYRRIEAQYLPGLVERVHQGADAAFAARVGRREPLPTGLGAGSFTRSPARSRGTGFTIWAAESRRCVAMRCSRPRSTETSSASSQL
jgi:hypothetical protein